MPYLELKDVSVGFGSGRARTEVLKDVNLSMEKGEFLAVLGYSGVGKSTLMNLIAGLVAPDTGEIVVDGKKVEGPSPDRGLVFQNYSLLPWLTVHGNVGMAVNRVFEDEDKTQRFQRIRDAIDRVSLSPAVEKRPAELSGGMRQRVSVARTLSTKPQLLLLDEPLSALDALTRSVIQDQILDIWEKEQQTVILITNDVDEGLYMADRILPLSMGPAATFGPEAVVDMPRPRHRKAMGQHEGFRTLRTKIIRYLLDIRSSQVAGAADDEEVLTLPDVQPMNITDARRTAYRGQQSLPNRRFRLRDAS
ncbi:ABC transporter ATP-binding protein [soil metagenome]